MEVEKAYLQKWQAKFLLPVPIRVNYGNSGTIDLGLAKAPSPLCSSSHPCRFLSRIQISISIVPVAVAVACEANRSFSAGS